MKPKVTLINQTKDPIGGIFVIWELSKGERSLEEIRRERSTNPAAVREIFEKVVDSQIPVAENIDFTFLLENVSISFREQMVRHRIGVKVGPNLGIDQVPDLADSTWWSQSMRILDMGRFAKEDRYREPENLDEAQRIIYRRAMESSEDSYNMLLRSGMSMEDAREVIPLGATHRLTWKLNLAALQHIIGKRGCQILQGDLWEPIINGMVNELCNEIDPYFRRLIAPPCIRGDKYVGCKFKIDNERRVAGLDEIPPCTLYVGQETDLHVFDKFKDSVRFQKMGKQYGDLWDRDPMTFEKR